MAVDTSSLQWFAVQTVVKRERLSATVLANKGYEYFLPLGWHGSPRPKEPPPPLFPGYLFCRCGRSVVGPLLTTPGVIRIVGIGNRPSPIDDGEIHNIRRIHNSGMPAERCRFLEIGQRIVVCSGPLAGVEGVLVSLNEPDYLVASVTLLQRSVRVRLDANWVLAAPRAVSEMAVVHGHSTPLLAGRRAAPHRGSLSVPTHRRSP
jgi:transcriptional antiterminator RfaH